MKINVVPCALAAATLFLLPLNLPAEPDAPEKKPMRRPPPQAQQQAERLARFDTNQDGKLDKAERQKARETVQTEVSGRFRERTRQFDKDGDGKLSAEERSALENAHRAQVEKRPGVMKRFDGDGDGSLSDTEWAKARKEMRRRMGPKEGPSDES